MDHGVGSSDHFQESVILIMIHYCLNSCNTGTVLLIYQKNRPSYIRGACPHDYIGMLEHQDGTDTIGASITILGSLACNTSHIAIVEDDISRVAAIIRITPVIS